MHQVHTLNQPVRTGHAHCAVSWRAVALYRGPTPSVSRAPSTVSSRARVRCAAHCVVLAPTRCAACIAAHNVVSWRTVAVSQPLAALYHDTWLPPLTHDTILYHDPAPSGQALTHACRSPCAGAGRIVAL